MKFTIGYQNGWDKGEFTVTASNDAEARQKAQKELLAKDMPKAVIRYIEETK